MAQSDVVYDVGLDLKDFKKSKKELDNSFKKTQKNANDMNGSMTKGFKTSTVAIAGMAAGAVALSTAIAFGIGQITTGVKKFNEQAKVEATLEQTLKSTGHAAGITSDEIKDLASSLQTMTTFGDEAIIGSSNLLLTFKNLGKDVFPRAQKAVLDMSAALGQDLKSSSIQLGKALNEPTKGLTALSRVGVSFTEDQKKQIKVLEESNDLYGAQAILLKEIESQFGGVAAAQAKTFGGMSEQINNTLGDFQEKIGKGFTEELIDPLDGLISMLSNNSTILSAAAKDFGKMAASILSVGAEAVTFWGDIFSSMYSAAKPEIQQLHDLQMDMKAEAHKLDMLHTAQVLKIKKANAKKLLNDDIKDAKKLNEFEDKDRGRVTGKTSIQARIFSSLESNNLEETLKLLDENSDALNQTFEDVILSIVKSKLQQDAYTSAIKASTIAEKKAKDDEDEAKKKADDDAKAAAASAAEAVAKELKDYLETPASIESFDGLTFQKGFEEESKTAFLRYVNANKLFFDKVNAQGKRDNKIDREEFKTVIESLGQKFDKSFLQGQTQKTFVPGVTKYKEEDEYATKLGTKLVSATNEVDVKNLEQTISNLNKELAKITGKKDDLILTSNGEKVERKSDRIKQRIEEAEKELEEEKKRTLTIPTSKQVLTGKTKQVIDEANSTKGKWVEVPVKISEEQLAKIVGGEAAAATVAETFGFNNNFTEAQWATGLGDAKSEGDAKRKSIREEMRVESNRIQKLEEEALEEERENNIKRNDEFLNGINTMISSVDSAFISMDATIKQWTADTDVTFSEGMSRTAAIMSSFATGAQGFGTGLEGVLGDGALGSLIPGFGIAATGLGFISSLFDVLGDSGDDASANDIASENAKNNADIVSTAVDTIIVNANMSVYTTYVDEAGFDQMFTDEIAPRFAEYVQGVY